MLMGRACSTRRTSRESTPARPNGRAAIGAPVLVTAGKEHRLRSAAQPVIDPARTIDIGQYRAVADQVHWNECRAAALATILTARIAAAGGNEPPPAMPLRDRLPAHTRKRCRQTLWHGKHCCRKE